MKYVVIAGAAIVIIFLIALSFIPIGIEPLSEVYFENHTKLPVNIFLKRDYNFTFTVHNLEYREMQYNYDINAFYGNKSLNIDKSDFVLADNESASFFHKFRFNESFERAQIVINVTKDNNESIDIHFWVDEIVPVRITFNKTNSNVTSNL